MQEIPCFSIPSMKSAIPVAPEHVACDWLSQDFPSHIPGVTTDVSRRVGGVHNLGTGRIMASVVTAPISWPWFCEHFGIENPVNSL
jgi:hypothetical protein